jgi:hypothetical protein
MEPPAPDAGHRGGEGVVAVPHHRGFPYVVVPGRQGAGTAGGADVRIGQVRAVDLGEHGGEPGVGRSAEGEHRVTLPHR